LQKNHPTRVLTLVYQPFALGVSALLAYHEAKINTRLRNLTGYTIYFLSSFGIIIVSEYLSLRQIETVHKLYSFTLCLDASVSTSITCVGVEWNGIGMAFSSIPLQSTSTYVD
jgi:hypothetical protein